jgi:hypothetical protein
MKKLMRYFRLSPKKAFTPFSIFVLMAALGVGVFWGCQKEQSIKDSSVFTAATDVLNQKPTISIDEAKEWFENNRKSANSVGSQDESSLFVPNATLNWQKAQNDFSQNGTEFVTAPIKNPLFEINGDVNLLVYKDSIGRLTGCFMLYLADKEYHNATNGQYNPLTFTGIVVYTDINGYAFLSCKIENGQYVKYLTSSVKLNASGSNPLGVRACLSVCVPGGFVLTGCSRVYEFCDCSPCSPSIGGGGTTVLSQPPGTSGTSGTYQSNNGSSPTTTTNGSSNSNNSGGGSWGSSQASGVFNNAGQVIDKLEQDGFDRDKVNGLGLGFSALKNFYSTWSKYDKIGFTANEFWALYSNQNLLSQANGFFGKYGNKFTNRLSKIRSSSTSIEMTIANIKGFINTTNAIENELSQLAQQNVSSISSGGDMGVLMKIFGKVLGKKIGKVIPFIGTGLGVEAAWSAYSLGNYGEAAFELAGVMMDFLPVGIVLETGWTVVDIAYNAFKAYKPIAKISSYCTSGFAHVFTGLFNTIDDLNLFDKLDDITTGNSVTNISVNVSQAGKTTQDFLDNLASSLGLTWTPHPSGAGLIMDLGGNSNLFFYTRSSTGNPGIQVTFNGVKVFKIDFQ